MTRQFQKKVKKSVNKTMVLIQNLYTNLLGEQLRTILDLVKNVSFSNKSVLFFLLAVAKGN